MSEWNLDRIENAFAAAAIDTSLWNQAVEVVTTETRSFGAVLFPEPGHVLPGMPYTDSMTPCMEEYMRDGWYLKDERNRGIRTLIRNGVADDLDVMGIEHIRRHPYYQEFLASHGLQWFAAVRILSEDKLWVLSIQRSIKSEPFSTEEKGRLARLVHTLPASVTIARALGWAGAASALDAFDTSLTAAVLIDRQGRVARANASAERTLKGEVSIRGRRIVAADPSATAALDRALHRLIFSRDAGGLSEPVLLARTGRGPLLAYPGRLPSQMANPLADCQAVVVFVDPRHRPLPPDAMLRSVYRLTEAEARLAAYLAIGESLDVACNHLRIAKETGRNHLKSIFAKTGVNRQVELIVTLNRFFVPSQNGGR